MPFLQANAAAHARGDKTFRFEALDMPYEQGTFKYQVKCLAELRRRFASLDGRARARAEQILEQTGGLEALV